MARTLETGHYVLEVLQDPPVVKLTRSAEEFTSVIQMVSVLDDIFRAIEGVDGARYGLMMDAREGPFRDDPDYQQAFKLFRERLDSRFARVGVVVLSPESVKVLRESGIPDNVRVYADPAAAMRWAADAEETPSMRIPH